ncbi:MAG: hypothetical protein CL685_00940 [Candidatus Magasanikbacteria bacterium]|nr:hypothetical protein [Candidatus Magasanikbacteria bacterium]|tara:strand:- start:3009 stop:3917 length:909 start_codon:yes stop_codon:yes gene_type:complete
MKYLVTGGAGFIGTNIVIRLKKDGHDVVVLDNYCAGKKEDHIQDGVEYVEGDIRDLDILIRTMEGVDGVFHQAAVPRVTYSVEHPVETHDNNVNGTLNVLVAAKDRGVKRVVFATSSSVFGCDEKIDLREDMPKRPKSPYALHKLMGQEYCRLFAELYGLETVALCYYNIYGPYLDPNGAYALVIGKFLQQVKDGKPMTICGDGELFRDYTHVHDAVEANILAMTKDTVGKGEMINIGNNNPVSVNRLVEIIGGESVNVAERPGDPRYACADNTKAKELLGWSPTIEIEEGIRQMKEYFNLV